MGVNGGKKESTFNYPTDEKKEIAKDTLVEVSSASPTRFAPALLAKPTKSLANNQPNAR